MKYAKGRIAIMAEKHSLDAVKLTFRIHPYKFYVR